MILFLLLGVLICELIGSLVGRPLIGLAAGLVLVVLLTWANSPHI